MDLATNAAAEQDPLVAAVVVVVAVLHAVMY